MGDVIVRSLQFPLSFPHSGYEIGVRKTDKRKKNKEGKGKVSVRAYVFVVIYPLAR